MFSGISLMAVLLASVASVLIGMVWYSPKVGFGKTWMRLSGASSARPPLRDTLIRVFFGLITSFIFAYALAIILRIANATTLAESFLLGALVWLGIVAMHQTSAVIWEKQPFSLFLINTGYEFVRIIAMSAILLSL